MLNIEEYLNKKFSSYRDGEWLIHSHDYYGADFGFLLQHREIKWILLTYEESGYYPSSIIFDDLTEKQVWKLIENFQATKSSYKTQRK